MIIDNIKHIFNNDSVVNYYDNLTSKAGLLKSEGIIIKKYIKYQDKILDLGCGAGRTTIGLYHHGFKNIIGVDISEKMIERARINTANLDLPIIFNVSDALSLYFGDKYFKCVFFSFNGLMLIPFKKNRNKAVTEIYRILDNSGYFIFSTPYLDNKLTKPFWVQRSKELKIDNTNEKYGDILIDDFGLDNIYIHIPMSYEVIEMLNANAFEVIEMVPRTNICEEDEYIENELDDNMYWVARKK
ncbi:MAG: class I SAM-dependent methyltransferase [Bacteroidales bacterium]|jgi:ubiquinone/menaquinone biosynthesis C-methylase UbiE|nr:class I SAM-dependent methyltransferase [Bacteroidales bacterium]